MCHLSVICFILQPPLVFAAKNGHTEIVAMLLQADGIDVNKGVSLKIPTSICSLSALLLLTPITSAVNRLDLSVLIPITVTSCLGREGGSHRDCGHVLEG